MRIFLLAAMSAVLAVSAAQLGGVWIDQWVWCALGLAAAAFLNWLTCRRRQCAPRGWTITLATLFSCWMTLQLIPLPPTMVAFLSPARAAAAAAAGSSGWLPLTVAPPLSGEFFLDMLPAVLALLLARELYLAWDDKPWLAATPIIAVAWLESVLGLIQFYLARMAGGEAASSIGTYRNRNHFAGLLEMALPLAVMCAFSIWRHGNSRHVRPAGTALGTATLLGAATCILLGIVVSLSRMGFLASLTGMALTGVMVLGASGEKRLNQRHRLRWILPVSLMAVLCVLGFIYLPTDELINRFATFAQTDEISKDTRAELWRDTKPMIAAYWLTGSGLGTYESAFARFKNTAPMNTADFAHNDYLQSWAELGSIGFLLGWLLLGRILWRLSRMVLLGRDRPGWELSVGLMGALAAMMLHSLVDFNLYIPTNAYVVGWLCGLADMVGEA